MFLQLTACSSLFQNAMCKNIVAILSRMDDLRKLLTTVTSKGKQKTPIQAQLR
jgi:hypothetical protein